MKLTCSMWPKDGHPANHSHEVIPSCQVLRLLDSASFLATCKRLAEKEIKEAGSMTDGLGALERGDLQKVIGPATIRATLGSQLELLSARRIIPGLH
jgi:hypothetical protein